MIDRGVSRNMREVCDELSIFDWWTDRLSIAHMKQMRTFLKNAIKLGFTGYVCFKVGVSGCANGMWAYKTASTDGYSPDGDCLYRSFTPNHTYWNACLDDTWFPESCRVKFDSCKTINQLKALIQTNTAYSFN